MTFTRSLVLALAFIVPASFTIASADEAKGGEKKDKVEKKEKKEKGKKEEAK
jgi:hypothetical protein